MDTTREYPEIFCTVDVVALRLRNNALEVGLIRREASPFENQLALPGGFVRAQEDADSLGAAKRILQSKTGFLPAHLEQLATYSGSKRDPRGFTVSIVYLALIREEEAHQDTPLLHWMPVGTAISARAKLAFDHSKIIADALTRIKGKALYAHTPAYFMGATFTFPQLQQVYETVLDEKIAKKTFRRWVLDADILEPLNTKAEVDIANPARPAQQYRLNFKALSQLR